MATKKAYELALELADEFRKRMGSTFGLITEGVDSNGDSTISLVLDSTTPLTTEKNLFIRVKAQPWGLAKDVLGLTAQIYTPTVIEYAIEANPAGGSGADNFTIGEAATIAMTIGKRGTRVDVYQETAGTVPSVTTFDTASKRLASFAPELYWPLLAQQ